MASSTLFDPLLCSETVTLQPGDTLVLYSDGIPEAMDPESGQFGEERMVASLRAAAGESASAQCSALVERAKEFARGAAQHDDMTLVVLRRVL
jgi:sigma-B regulation protein RsbU (phosphoserine phosphatase)